MGRIRMLSIETMEVEDPAEVDSIKNRVLLLYAMDELERYGSLDKWKIQKTCFFTQCDAQSKRLKGTTYQFFKWKHGPMSVGIVEDLDVFNMTGLVQLRPNRANESVTGEGKNLVSEMKSFIEADENRAVIDHLNGWVHRLGPFTGKRLRDMSHECLAPYRGSMTSIDEIPEGTSLLNPIRPRDISYDFTIPTEWIRTLSVVFSHRYPEIRQIMTTPFRECDLQKWSDVFGSE